MLLPLLLNNLLSDADTTAPVLSNPTGAASGATTATGTVDTANDSNGTLYFWATTNSSESAANIKANGSSQAVTATGTQNVSVTGLTAETTYYLHFVHDDSSDNESNVVSSSAFLTEAELVGGGGSRGRKKRYNKVKKWADWAKEQAVLYELEEIEELEQAEEALLQATKKAATSTNDADEAAVITAIERLIKEKIEPAIEQAEEEEAVIMTMLL